MEPAKAPKLLVIPENLSQDAQFLTLPHRRTAKPSRYLFDPSQQSVYELTLIAAPKTACRSWLIQGRRPPKAQIKVNGITSNGIGLASPKVTEGLEVNQSSDRPGNTLDSFPRKKAPELYTSSNSQLLIATPIDPLFLFLPALCSSTTEKASSSPTASTKQLFLSLDDLLEPLSEKAKHFTTLSNHPGFRPHIQRRLELVSDSVEAGDESMYRLNREKLWKALVGKAERIVAAGSLPKSMEENFVRRPMQAPVSLTAGDVESSAVSQAPGSPKVDSQNVESQQSSVPSLTSSLSTISSTSSLGADGQDPQAAISLSSAGTSAAVQPNSQDVPASTELDDRLSHLLRLHAALTFIATSYLPSNLSNELLNLISASTASPAQPHPANISSCFPDFGPMHSHLAQLSALRNAASAAQSIGDFSLAHGHKRSAEQFFDENAALEAEAEKERKKRAKNAESKAVRDLKKVNVSGMKSLDSFFKKKTAASNASPGPLRRSPRKGVA